MVRLVWSRIVRLPAEGSFRRLLKLLYPASSRPVKRRSAANLGILEEFWRDHRVRHRPWIFTLPDRLSTASIL